MSFASTANSTLIPVLEKSPTVNPDAVGYVENLVVLSDVNHASGTQQNVITAITLPIGVWILNGAISLAATGGTLDAIPAPQMVVKVDGVDIIYAVATAGVSVVQFPVNIVLSSTDYPAGSSLSIQVSAVTSGGADYLIEAGTTSVLKLVRVA